MCCCSAASSNAHSQNNYNLMYNFRILIFTILKYTITTHTIMPTVAFFSLLNLFSSLFASLWNDEKRIAGMQCACESSPSKILVSVSAFALRFTFFLSSNPTYIHNITSEAFKICKFFSLWFQSFLFGIDTHARIVKSAKKIQNNFDSCVCAFVSVLSFLLQTFDRTTNPLESVNSNRIFSSHSSVFMCFLTRIMLIFVCVIENFSLFTELNSSFTWHWIVATCAVHIQIKQMAVYDLFDVLVQRFEWEPNECVSTNCTCVVEMCF